MVILKFKNEKLGKFLLISLLFLLLTSIKIVEASESEAHLDHKKKSDQAYNWFPVIFHTQETSLALGVGTMQVFQRKEDKENSRPNSITALAYYTLEKQYSVNVVPNLYFNNDEYNTKFIFNYSKIPSLFFGTGENLSKDYEGEDYETENVMVQTDVLKKIVANFRIGLRFDWQNYDVLEKEANGFLDQLEYIGNDGGTTSGLGFILDRDNRDHIFWPKNGGYHQFIAMKYTDKLGSDFDFTQYTADLRQFISIGKNNVLALQGVAQFNEGDIPFNRLAQLGGPLLMRGIYQGRYRNNHQIALQSEYRFPFKHRWSMSVFASVGDVVHNIGDFDIRDFKYTFGGGFKYALDPKNKLNLRMDIGISEFGISPIIILGEAF